MTTDTVELHFIDGPLAGTRKMEHKDAVLRNGTYRYLFPLDYLPKEEKVSYTKQREFKVVCAEFHYIFVSLPPGHSRLDRFAMLLESALR